MVEIIIHRLQICRERGLFKVIGDNHNHNLRLSHNSQFTKYYELIQIKLIITIQSPYHERAHSQLVLAKLSPSPSDVFERPPTNTVTIHDKEDTRREGEIYLPTMKVRASLRMKGMSE